MYKVAFLGEEGGGGRGGRKLRKVLSFFGIRQFHFLKYEIFFLGGREDFYFFELGLFEVPQVALYITATVQKEK